MNQERGKSPSLACDPHREIKEAIRRLRARKVQYYLCREERGQKNAVLSEHVVITPGRRLPTPLEVESVDTSEILRIYGVEPQFGTGRCAAWKRIPAGFSLTLLPCSSPLDSIADAVRDIVEPQLPGVRVPVLINVEIPEPRCTDNKDDCAAIPYLELDAGAPPRDRVVVNDPRQYGPTGCAVDGDCLTAGCGNECVSWPFGMIAGSCDGRAVLQGAFCGCVDGICRWFTEQAPAPDAASR